MKMSLATINWIFLCILIWYQVLIIYGSLSNASSYHKYSLAFGGQLVRGFVEGLQKLEWIYKLTSFNGTSDSLNFDFKKSSIECLDKYIKAIYSTWSPKFNNAV